MPASPTTADVEYRVVWNQISRDWEIYRNGAKTTAARRKKQSAIDIAILALRAEDRPPGAKAIVTSLKDNAVKTEWESPPSGNDNP
jgi:hypothetical protein